MFGRQRDGILLGATVNNPVLPSDSGFPGGDNGCDESCRDRYKFEEPAEVGTAAVKPICPNDKT